jgi:hypothetical protein
MMALARASANAYNFYTSARARWLMASNYRSKPRYHARATTLSETVVSLSMAAHNWRCRCSLARPSSSRQDALHLGQGPMSHAHDLIHGNVIRCVEGGVPQDHL